MRVTWLATLSLRNPQSWLLYSQAQCSNISVQCTFLHRIYLNITVNLLPPPSPHVNSWFPTEIPYHSLIPSVRATCPSSLILLDSAKCSKCYYYHQSVILDVSFMPNTKKWSHRTSNGSPVKVFFLTPKENLCLCFNNPVYWSTLINGTNARFSLNLVWKPYHYRSLPTYSLIPHHQYYQFGSRAIWRDIMAI
jgi:hypothetical protein